MTRRIIKTKAPVFRNSNLRNTTQSREIEALDYYTLISCCLQAYSDAKIGWNHAETALDSWMMQLGERKIKIQDDHLEDALYAANMLNEVGEFRHPKGSQFRQLLKRVLKPGEKFDKLLNIIDKERKNNE